MLYYTLKNEKGEVEATYNGRFAFIHFRDDHEMKKVYDLREDNDLRGLWTSPHEPGVRDAAGILAHEYTHKQIYALSRTGLFLNGYRAWARTRFLMLGSRRCVEDYYRMRTVHLMETRQYHEALAKAIDDEMAKPEPATEAVFEQRVRNHGSIADAERSVLEKWKAMGLLPSGMRERFHRSTGQWMQENFAAMVAFHDEEGRRVVRDLADRGIANDITEFRDKDRWRERTAKSLIRNFTNRFPGHWENFDARFEWFWHGQRAQFETLRDHYGFDHAKYLAEILHPSTLFVLDWSGIPANLHGTFVELAEDTLAMDRAAFMSRWGAELDRRKADPHFTHFFGFFHLHGN